MRREPPPTISSTMPTARRPQLLVVFSLLAFLVVVLIGIIAFLDQHQRIANPEKYAERRCRAAFFPETNSSPPPSGGPNFTPRQFTTCVQKERSKSTLASIYPLFVTGVVVAILGISGIVVGAAQVRRSDDLDKKLHGG